MDDSIRAVGIDPDQLGNAPIQGPLPYKRRVSVGDIGERLSLGSDAASIIRDQLYLLADTIVSDILNMPDNSYLHWFGDYEGKGEDEE